MENKNNVGEIEEVLSDVFSKILGVDINLLHIDDVLKDEKEQKSQECDEEEESKESEENQECEKYKKINSEIDSFVSMRDKFELAEEKFFELEEEHLSVETTKRYEHPKTIESSLESILALKSPNDELETIAKRTTKETFFINDDSKIEENEVFKKEGNAYVCKSTRVEEYEGKIYKGETEVTIEFFDC